MRFSLKKIFLLTLLGLLIPLSAWCAEPSIEVRVDRNSITLGENLNLKIIIKGGSALTRPDIPPMPNFDVVGQSSGSSIEILNGQMSVTMSFDYVLSPRKKGSYTIGPIKTYIEGRTYSSGPIRISVLERDQSQSYLPPPQTVPTQPRYVPTPGQLPPGWPQRPMTPQPQPKGREDTFLTAETDKKEAYIGEQILFTFRLYSSVSVQNAQLSLPDFKDFISEEVIKERKFYVELDGKRYAVNEWRLVLFPTKAGELKTGKSTVTGMVPVATRLSSPFDDPFFQPFPMRSRLKQRTFTSPDITINVKELPPAPEGFMGLVGQFSISSHLTQDKLNMGETINLEVDISGKGNIGEANLPHFPSTPFFKVYPGKPTLKIEKSLKGLEGKKIFNYALVAERPGQTTLPSIELFYFNPETSIYEKLRTDPKEVLILGSAKGEKLVTAGIDSPDSPILTGNKVLDLRPIKPAQALIFSQILTPWKKTLWWILLFGSPGIYFFYAFLKHRQAKALAQAEDRKRSKAFKKAKVALGKIETSAEKGDFSAFSVVLRDYLSDRFLVKGGALTPSEVEALLREKEAPAEVIRRMVYLLEQMDSWKYGGFTQNLPEEKELKQEIMNLLREIEKSA